MQAIRFVSAFGESMSTPERPTAPEKRGRTYSSPAHVNEIPNIGIVVSAEESLPREVPNGVGIHQMIAVSTVRTLVPRFEKGAVRPIEEYFPCIRAWIELVASLFPHGYAGPDSRTVCLVTTLPSWQLALFPQWLGDMRV